MKKILLVVFACLIMLSMMVATVTAQTTWTEFEGISTKVGDLPGGEEWYSKDFTKVFVRDLGELYSMDVDDPRLAGDLTLTFSANFKITDPPAIVYGPIWGSVYLENDGGTWEGQITGKRTEQGFNYLFSVLHGHGDYEGMIAHVYWVRETTGLFDPIMVHGLIK